MLRTHTCGELTLKNIGQEITLSGWVYRNREMGGLTFVDLRDRYGVTQLVFDANKDKALGEKASALGREYVIKVIGKVQERSKKNPNISTGDIEIIESFELLNASKTPPFTLEDETDGGEELRMKYRYIDLVGSCKK